MNYDISRLLQEWDYEPGQVVARRFKGRDGRERIQLRVDLGILQMLAEGRPDGKRPMGQESWYDFYRLRAGLQDGKSPPFQLKSEDCARLQQESIQYHHRYICLFQLGDYDAVVRDADRNLAVFEFVAQHAESNEIAWSVQLFTPQLLMMRTRAMGTRALKAGLHDDVLTHIDQGIEALEAFYRAHDREDLLDQSGELNSLKQWRAEIEGKRPLSEHERLRRELEEAIRIEDYEAAARLRDRMKKLRGSPPS